MLSSQFIIHLIKFAVHPHNAQLIKLKIQRKIK